MKVSDALGALIARAIDGATPEERHWALVEHGRRLVDMILEKHFQGGWTASPFRTLLLQQKMIPYGLDAAQADQLRFAAAMERDISKLIRVHHEWRHKHAGNVVWQFSGPTGYGKSSCALYLLESLNKVRPEDLRAHITIDVPELPILLPKLPRGSAVLVDEQAHAVGEGTLSKRALAPNATS